MSVLLVVKGLGPGGAERLLVAATQARGVDAPVFECAYVLPFKDHLAGELEAGGVRCTCVSRRRRDILWPMRLRRLIRDGQFDIVHGHSPLPMSVARLAVWSLRRTRRPVLVSTEHNAWPTFRWPTRLLNSATAGFDAASFAVSDEVRTSMRRSVRGRAETLTHGIDVAAVVRLKAERFAAREEFGIGRDEFVICTVANLREQKDYPNLLRAARVLADRGLAFRLVAVGQGPLEKEIRELVRRLDLEDRVMLTGFRPDAVRVMAAADVFTLASKWEGLPVAVMEACALGLPIVATAVGGVREKLRGDVDALLVAPGDHAALAEALWTAVTDDVIRTRLAAASAEKAPDFDVSRARQTIEAAYARVAPAGVKLHDASPVPARRLSPVLDVRPATRDDRPAILELLSRTLGWGDDPRYAELFSWKHDHSAFGSSAMWVATDGRRVVGLRAFMRWEFLRDGETLRAVRAVDTATDPEYQGRGLFTALTLHGLEALREEGVQFVFNTPNSQSRPGYLKMGWREVGQLPVSIALSRLRGALKLPSARVPADRWSLDMPVGVAPGLAMPPRTELVDPSRPSRAVITNRSAEYLEWRYQLPTMRYRFVQADQGFVVVRCRHRGGARELVLLDYMGVSSEEADAVAKQAAFDARADYVIRLGAARVHRGYMPLALGRPTLTWRGLGASGMPPLPNWQLTMGDVELF